MFIFILQELEIFEDQIEDVERALDAGKSPNEVGRELLTILEV